jgi:hypothetical protein
MVSRGDAGVTDGSGLDRELAEVAEVLLANFRSIRAAFTYYSCVGGCTGNWITCSNT